MSQALPGLIAVERSHGLFQEYPPIVEADAADFIHETRSSLQRMHALMAQFVNAALTEPLHSHMYAWKAHSGSMCLGRSECCLGIFWPDFRF